MPFSNPIIAGEELIRSSMRSENYVNAAEGGIGAGWSINRDGTADFYNLTTRGSAEGPVAAYDTVIANNSLLYMGTELGALLTEKERGYAGYFERTTTSVTAGVGVQATVARLTVPTVAGRAYRLKITGSMYTNGYNDGHIDVYVRYTTSGVEPTTASPILRLTSVTNRIVGHANGFELEKGLLGNGNELKLLLCFKGLEPVGATFAMYGEATWPIIMYVEDMGAALPLLGINDDGASAPPKTYRSILTGAFDSRSYQGNGTALSSGNGAQYMYQGDIGVDGNRRSWCWFDNATILALQGVPYADIDYLDIYFYFQHWYYSSGGYCHIGWHDKTGVSNTEQGGARYDVGYQQYTGRNQGRWINIKENASLRNGLYDGYLKGIVLVKDGGNSLTDYGIALGATGGNNRPFLRAGYYK